MRRACLLFALLLLVTPARSGAMQLHWISGATNVTCTTATRCTLVVQADSTESFLPGEWRLQWVADSSGVHFSALDSTDACLADTAKVSAIDPPATPADSVANTITAHFCWAGLGDAARACYLVDLVGGSHGKLRAVALNPADTTEVIESNEVTFNGGVWGGYAPLILLAGRTHFSSELQVNAVGVGLGAAHMVQIVAPDTTWRLALNVTERTATGLKAAARVAADLPSCVLQVGESPGEVAFAVLSADTASVLSVQPACVDYMKEINLITHEQIQPKDFAIVTSRDSFHVFYIRHDMNLSMDATEKSVGHKRSRNLNDWFPTENTMTAIQVRPRLWDDFHVWAPTIVKRPEDITFYMLYTGVQRDSLGHQIQRIGVATSTDLNVWEQDSTWTYSPDHAPNWAELDSTTYSGQQFRDPFVMEDPDSSGHYLMFFVAGSHARKPRMVVGVARTQGAVADFRKWYDVGPLWNTDSLHSRAQEVESPHAFADSGGRWALYYTGYNPVDHAAIERGDSTTYGRDSAFVTFQTDNASASSPIDPDTTRWSAPDTLYKFLGGDQTLQFWHGSEYLNWAPGYQYLGAYDDNQHAVDISQVSWRSSHTFVLNDSCPPSEALRVESKGEDPALALGLAGAMPSRVPVAFKVETSTKARVHLAVYDVLGRRIQTLLEGEVPAGHRVVRWDGCGVSGVPVGSGVYFARLSGPAGRRVARVVLLR